MRYTVPRASLLGVSKSALRTLCNTRLTIRSVQAPPPPRFLKPTLHQRGFHTSPTQHQHQRQHQQPPRPPSSSPSPTHPPNSTPISISTTQPPQPQPQPQPSQIRQPSPHTNFYRTHGRALFKALTLAFFTYQVCYWAWLVLETEETKEQTRREMARLEGEVRILDEGRKGVGGDRVTGGQKG